MGLRNPHPRRRTSPRADRPAAADWTWTAWTSGNSPAEVDRGGPGSGPMGTSRTAAARLEAAPRSRRHGRQWAPAAAWATPDAAPRGRPRARRAARRRTSPLMRVGAGPPAASASASLKSRPPPRTRRGSPCNHRMARQSGQKGWTTHTTANASSVPILRRCKPRRPPHRRRWSPP
eukprot:9478718-Pyramimonas_sp.AAC.1